MQVDPISSRPIRIGTRGSPLALWQANQVFARLQPVAACEIVTVETAGDRDRVTALSALTSQGFFTKEVEQALLDERIDVAVHSMKDLPTLSPDGLEVVAILERGDPRDALLVRPDSRDPSAPDLPVRRGGRLGTGSNRRRAQVRSLRPDLELGELRGNAGTRVRKLAAGEYDAILIAEAALQRLGLDVGELSHHPLAVERMVPAPSQAAVAVQMRIGDARRVLVRDRVHHEPTAAAVAAERRLMRQLEGGCQLPLGVHARRAEPGDPWQLLASLAPPPPPGALPEPAGKVLDLSGPQLDQLCDQAFAELRATAARPPSLHGATVVVTRAPSQAGELIDLIEARGGKVELRPAVEIASVPVDEAGRRALQNPSAFDWILYTSANAVIGLDDALGGLPTGTLVGAIGTATARQLAQRGVVVDLIPETATAEGLAAAVLARADSSCRILLPVGNLNRDTLSELLSAAGHEVTSVQVYENRTPGHIEPLGDIDGPLFVLFASPSAVANFMAAQGSLPPQARLISIGPTTSRAIRAAGLDVHREAKPHSVQGLAAALA